MKIDKKIAFTLITVISFMIAFYLLFFNESRSIERLKQQIYPTASLYSPAKDVGEVLNFVADDKQIINLNEISAGKWSLLFFGFTNCPQICPMNMVKINQTVKQMSNKDDLQVFFISVDPERDIGVSDDYAKIFNDNFIGINMPIDKIKERKIGSTLGVYHEIIQTKKEAKMHEEHDNHNHEEHKHNYDINHTTSYILLNPELELLGILSSPNNPNDMAKALDKIITTLN